MDCRSYEYWLWWCDFRLLSDRSANIQTALIKSCVLTQRYRETTIVTDGWLDYNCYSGKLYS